MSSIVFEGNTYTFGATVSANPGTGTTSYVFGGLSSGWTYGFIIWAFNGVGPSSIVGPISKITLSELPSESRLAINAFAWNYQHLPEFDTFARTNGGNTYNLFASSENFGDTTAWIWPSTSGYSRIAGFTAPDGSTTAWNIISPNDGLPKSFTQTVFVDPGNTLIMSFYIDLSNTTKPDKIRRPTSIWEQIDSTTGNVLGSTADLLITIPPGTTGWWRVNYRTYHNSLDRRFTSSAMRLFAYVGSDGGPLNTIIWHPQLEISTG